MKKTTSTMIKIDQFKKQSTLSKTQKIFNKLVKEIDMRRSQLMEWQALLPTYQQKYSNEFLPLARSYDKYREALLHLFDKAWPNKLFNKNDKAKLSDLICSIAAELIAETDSAELKEIYNKHSKSNFDDEVDEEKETIKSIMESMFGIEIDEDIDFNSPEKMMSHLTEKMQQQILQDEQVAEVQRNKRKKSAKSLAKEAKQQEEALNVSQSIREVYRKLASALHPDREQNNLERESKTALMQRVNIAYENKNLLELLELQLEVEQIDQSMINSISENRLKHYNKILSEQSREISFEIDAVEFSFKMRFSISPEESVSPASAIDILEHQINEIQQDIHAIQHDLEHFDSIQNLKSWLKGYRVQSKSFREEDLFGELDIINSLRVKCQ